MTHGEKICQQFGPIVVKHFDALNKPEFLDMARAGGKNAASAFFWDAWQEVVKELLAESIPVNQTEAIEFFTLYFKDIDPRTGLITCWEDIWSDMVLNDGYFLHAHRMRIDLDTQAEIEVAKNVETKTAFNRKNELRRAIRRTFYNTSVHLSSDPNRLKMIFWEDLKHLVPALRELGIASTVEELQALLRQEMAGMRDATEILALVSYMRNDLATIEEDQGRYSQVETEQLQVVYVSLEEEEKPIPEPEIIELTEMVVDDASQKMVPQKRHYKIATMADLTAIIETITYQGDDESFDAQLKALFQQILIQYTAARNVFQLGELSKIAYRLQKFLEGQNKKAIQPQELTPKQAKFKAMVPAVNDFAYSLAEMKPASLKAYDGVTIK